MFRDTYKAANDDITPDVGLLSETLLRIQRAENRRRIPVRALSVCAAAIAVAVLSVSGYLNLTGTSVSDSPMVASVENAANEHLKSTSDYGKDRSSYTAGADIAESSAKTTDITQGTSGQTETKTSPAAHSENRQESKIGGNVKSGDENPKNSIDTSKDENALSDIKENQNNTPVEIIPDEGFTLAMSAYIAEDSAKDAASGGANSAAKRSVQKSAASDDAGSISLLEYSKYIGFDITEKISVPADFKREFGDEVPFGKDSDEVCFTWFGNNGRQIYIIPTKDEGRIRQLIQASDGTILSQNASYEYGDDFYTAYLISGDTGFTVNCYGISSDEFNVLIDSILR